MINPGTGNPWTRPRRVTAVGILVVFAALVLLPKGAPATIAEQRARLPPPAHCEDDVAGVWRSHSHWERFGQWYVMTLEIHRVPNDPARLHGTIRSHYWNGGPGDQEPPPCQPGGYRQIVRMTGGGSIANGVVTFGGTSWTLEQSFCGQPTTGYNLDVFSGRIDPEIQEFQSVNNDGGLAVNVPQVFRRVRCFDRESRPHIGIQPPAFQPPSREGCDFWPF